MGRRERHRGGEGCDAQEGLIGRETQTGDQELSLISCSKYIDKLDGPTMRCIGEL